MGIKPSLQARAGVECRARPTDTTITLPRGAGPFLHHQSDNQAKNLRASSVQLKSKAHTAGLMLAPDLKHKFKNKTLEQQRGTTCAKPGKPAASQRLPPSVLHRYDCRYKISALASDCRSIQKLRDTSLQDRGRIVPCG